MWNSNSFHGHGHGNGNGNYQPDFNNNDGFIPFPPLVQNFFPPGLPFTEFQPDAGQYNNGVFQQNFANTDSQGQSNSVQSKSILQDTSRPSLNARATKLKEELMRKKEERVKSGASPVNLGLNSVKESKSESANSLRNSPLTPGSRIQTPNLPKAVTLNDLDDLLSEAKATIDTNVKTGKRIHNAKQSIPLHLANVSAVQSPRQIPDNSASATTKTNANPQPLCGRLNEPRSTRESPSPSEISEGEVVDAAPVRFPPTGPRISQLPKTNHLSEQIQNSTRSSTTQNIQRTQEGHMTIPLRQSTIPATEILTSRQQLRDSGQTTERTTTSVVAEKERKSQPDAQHRTREKREIEDTSKSYREYKSNDGSRQDASIRRKADIPTLSQILPHDEDLREWLDLTGYHNTEERKKTLNRRRALAALEAQKAKILEEIEHEERGNPHTTSFMRLETQSLPVTRLQSISTPKPEAIESSSIIINDTPSRGSTRLSILKDGALKRKYTEELSSPITDRHHKVEQLDEDGSRKRTKNENEADYSRRHSTGVVDSRGRSSAPDSKSSNYGSRDRYRSEDRGRDRRRTPSYSPDYRPSSVASPTRRPYNTRKPYRSWSREVSPQPSRPFIVRGNYKGRSYDPHYRGRGRGRGH